MGEYMESIYGITINKLEEFLIDSNEKKFHATQIMDISALGVQIHMIIDI